MVHVHTNSHKEHGTRVKRKWVHSKTHTEVRGTTKGRVKTARCSAAAAVCVKPQVSASPAHTEVPQAGPAIMCIRECLHGRNMGPAAASSSQSTSHTAARAKANAPANIAQRKRTPPALFPLRDKSRVKSHMPRKSRSGHLVHSVTAIGAQCSVSTAKVAATHQEHGDQSLLH